MWRMTPLLLVVACTGAGTAPPSTVIEAGPIQVELDAGRGSHTDLAEMIDPTGAALARAGLDAYRFVSTVDYRDDPRLSSRYDGAVTVAPAATRIMAAGVAGTFTFLSNEQGTWYRFRDQWFTPSPQGFRWHPAGPIPSHFVASVIGRLALQSGTITDLGDEVVAGVAVSRLRRTTDAIDVDVLITDNGVVLGVELIEYLASTSRTVSFLISGPIEEFQIDPPL